VPTKGSNFPLILNFPQSQNRLALRKARRNTDAPIVNNLSKEKEIGRGIWKAMMHKFTGRVS
jgi:hypothetical protein